MKKKITSRNNGVKKFRVTGAMIALMLLLAGCSEKMQFARSTVVPAAEGVIKMKKDKNENYSIAIDIQSLAEPGRLQPPKKVYVAWLETKENGTKNIGQLRVSTGIFSQTLKASLQTVTPYKPVSIFITAEEDGSTSQPAGQTVLVSEK